MKNRIILFLRWIVVLPTAFCLATLAYVGLMIVIQALLAAFTNESSAFQICRIIMVAVGNVIPLYLGAVAAYVISPSHKMKAAQCLILLSAVSTCVNLYRAPKASNEHDFWNLCEGTLVAIAHAPLFFLLPNLLNPEKCMKYIEKRIPDVALRLRLKILLLQVLLIFVGTFIAYCRFEAWGYRLSVPLAITFLTGGVLVTLFAWRNLTTRFKCVSILLWLLCLPQLYDLLLRRMPAVLK